MKNSNLSQFPLYKTRKNETFDNVPALFSKNLEKHKKCTPFVQAYASLTEENSLLFIERDCKGWKCATCGPKLRLKWYKKQLNPILDAKYLETIVIDPEDWTKIRKRIQRADAQYMTFAKQNGKILVIVNEVFNGEELTQDRNKFLMEVIANTPLITRPISESRNWTKPKNKINSVKKEPKWKLIADCTISTIDEVEKILRKEGYYTNSYEMESVDIKAATIILKDKDYFRILAKFGIFIPIKVGNLKKAA